MLEEVVRDESGNIIQRRTVTSKVRIRCEICQEIIATIDRNTIEAPIEGWMFESPDFIHQIPDPFHHSLTWETMRCPVCQKRPFFADDPATSVIILLENNEHITVRPKEKLVPHDPGIRFEATLDLSNTVVGTLTENPSEEKSEPEIQFVLNNPQKGKKVKNSLDFKTKKAYRRKRGRPAKKGAKA
jgi:hypothetical protein